MREHTYETRATKTMSWPEILNVHSPKTKCGIWLSITVTVRLLRHICPHSTCKLLHMQFCKTNLPEVRKFISLSALQKVSISEVQKCLHVFNSLSLQYSPHALRLAAQTDEYFTLSVSSKSHLNAYLWIQDTSRCLLCERLEAESISSQRDMKTSWERVGCEISQRRISALQLDVMERDKGQSEGNDKSRRWTDSLACFPFGFILFLQIHWDWNSIHRFGWWSWQTCQQMAHPQWREVMPMQTKCDG